MLTTEQAHIFSCFREKFDRSKKSNFRRLVIPENTAQWLFICSRFCKHGQILLKFGVQVGNMFSITGNEKKVLRKSKMSGGSSHFANNKNMLCCFFAGFRTT
jgi:hypothetical protein